MNYERIIEILSNEYPPTDTQVIIERSVRDDYTEKISLTTEEFAELGKLIDNLRNKYYSWGKESIRSLETLIYSMVSSESIVEYIESKKQNYEAPHSANEWHSDDRDLLQMGVMYTLLTEDEKESIDKFYRAKIEMAGGNSLIEEMPNISNIISYMISNIVHDNSDNIKQYVGMLGDRLAVDNIDVEWIISNEAIEELTSIKTEDEFWNSKFISTFANESYERNGEAFVRSLQSVDTYGRGYNETSMRLFAVIDDDKKYDMASTNYKLALIDYNLMESQYQQVSIMLDSLDNFGRYNNHINSICAGMKRNSEFIPFDLSTEEMQVVMLRVQEKYDENALYYSRNNESIQGILGLISNESIKAYFETKPEIVTGLLEGKEPDEISEIIHDVDDDAYKSKVLLSLNVSAKSLSDVFTEIDDKYMRTQIVLTKQNSSDYTPNQTKEDALAKIENYVKIKEEFLSFETDEERASFLCGMHDGQTQEELNESFRDYNDIKSSLLEHIESSEERMRVIESLLKYEQPEIGDAASLARDMIREFFEDNSTLSDEQIEKMEEVFERTDIYFEEYMESSTRGATHNMLGEIGIAEDAAQNPNELLFYIIHEYSHALSLFEFRQNPRILDDIFEEGIADTFAHLVLKNYLEKYDEVSLDDQTITYDGVLRTVEKSGYTNQNGWTRTLLYPLEEECQDIAAVTEFLLGSKNDFFDIAIGEGFSDRFEKDYTGTISSVIISYGDIIRAHPNGFSVQREDSIYLIKNDRMAPLVSWAKEEGHINDEELMKDGITLEEELAEAAGLRFGEVGGQIFALERDIAGAERDIAGAERGA